MTYINIALVLAIILIAYHSNYLHKKYKVYMLKEEYLEAYTIDSKQVGSMAVGIVCMILLWSIN